jgi:hypothetical protein
MAGTNARRKPAHRRFIGTVRGQKTPQKQRRLAQACLRVERRQGGADRIGFANRCGKRTLGEQGVFRMMLTRRQIRIAPCGAPPPRMFRGDVLQPLRDYRAETMAHVLFEK